MQITFKFGMKIVYQDIHVLENTTFSYTVNLHYLGRVGPKGVRKTEISVT